MATFTQHGIPIDNDGKLDFSEIEEDLPIDTAGGVLQYVDYLSGNVTLKELNHWTPELLLLQFAKDEIIWGDENEVFSLSEVTIALKQAIEFMEKQ